MSTAIVMFILLGLVVVRVVLACTTHCRAAHWLVAPVLWAAIVVGAVGASGCVDDDDGQQIDAGDEPDAIAPNIDAAPDARPPDASPDAPTATLLDVGLVVGTANEHGYATVNFYVDCPEGAPNGPHAGTIELYSNLGLVDTYTFDWTCEFSSTQYTKFNLSCGLDVWARGTITHPVTGETVNATTDTAPTLACES